MVKSSMEHIAIANRIVSEVRENASKELWVAGVIARVAGNENPLAPIMVAVYTAAAKVRDKIVEII